VPSARQRREGRRRRHHRLDANAGVEKGLQCAVHGRCSSKRDDHRPSLRQIRRHRGDRDVGHRIVGRDTAAVQRRQRLAAHTLVRALADDDLSVIACRTPHHDRRRAPADGAERRVCLGTSSRRNREGSDADLGARLPPPSCVDFDDAAGGGRQFNAGAGGHSGRPPLAGRALGTAKPVRFEPHNGRNRRLRSHIRWVNMLYSQPDGY
jgi:hypothetical protein